jgi:urate oxidase
MSSPAKIPGSRTEEFCQVLAKKYLDSYPQVVSVASRRMKPNGAA